MARNRQYLFCHVPKTGGTSFRHLLGAVFAPQDIYPNESEIAVNGGYLRFRELDRARVRKCRLLVGHVPAVARKLFDASPHVMIMMREPVSRALSNLRHVQRMSYSDLSLEAVFEMPNERRTAVANRQTRLLSFRSVKDALAAHRSTLDRSCLRRAKDALAAASFVGLTEQFDQSVRLCEQTFGWTLPDLERRQNVSPPLDEEMEHLLPRIQDAVQLDIELYDFATRLFAMKVAASSMQSPRYPR